MPAPGEPLWLEEDRTWALALLSVEGEQCPGCGQPWGESSDKEAEFAWTAEIARCHACAAGHRAVANHEKAGGDTRGLHVRVMRR